MSQPDRPAYWLFTPIVAFGAALVGIVALYYAELAILGGVVDAERLCEGRAECGLGVLVGLLVAGFFALVAAFVAGMIVAVARRDDTPRMAVAARRGLIVAAWCVLAYLLATIVIWWPKT